MDNNTIEDISDDLPPLIIEKQNIDGQIFEQLMRINKRLATLEKTLGNESIALGNESIVLEKPSINIKLIGIKILLLGGLATTLLIPNLRKSLYNTVLASGVLLSACLLF